MSQCQNKHTDPLSVSSSTRPASPSYKWTWIHLSQFVATSFLGACPTAHSSAASRFTSKHFLFWSQLPRCANIFLPPCASPLKGQMESWRARIRTSKSRAFSGSATFGTSQFCLDLFHCFLFGRKQPLLQVEHNVPCATSHRHC